MTKKYEWILFDADNTLFDFDGASKDAFMDVLGHHEKDKLTSTYSTYKKLNKTVWEELERGEISIEEVRSKRFRIFLEAMDWEGDPLEWNRLYLESMVDYARLYPDSIKVLHHFVQNYKLGIITNGLKEVQRPRINKVQIKDFFQVIVVSDEIGISKPHTAYFDITFKEMGYPDKKKVLVVGDNPGSDILGAQNYGLDACWLNAKELDFPLNFKPKFTIKEIGKLIDVLA